MKAIQVLIAILLAVITAGLGYFVIDRQREKESAETRQTLLDVTVQAMAARDQEIRLAIAQGRVVIGMSSYQVRQAWGNPSIVTNRTGVPDQFRAMGVSEIWTYETKGSVALDSDSTVVIVSGR